jgi:UDP-N-acetylmuramate: L-alanyl-gamma-D-glutamyl-meso-diaminopimelate ligase
LLNIEFDHADIYKDLAHVQASFEKLVALLPGDGLCIAHYDDPVVMEVVQGAICPVQTFGLGSGAMWRLGEVKEDEKGFHFEIVYKSRSLGKFRTPLFGEHNLLNLMVGIIAAVNHGADVERIRPIVERFRGARRRQEILMETPIVLVDDFAHHPTEVKATLTAVRRRFPKGKLWALFEPRSATARRAVHQEAYASAFDSADRILVSIPYKSGELKEGERLSTDTLVEDLIARGKNAQAVHSSEEILKSVLAGKQARDVVVVMSNGEFDKIQEKLVKALS